MSGDRYADAVLKGQGVWSAGVGMTAEQLELFKDQPVHVPVPMCWADLVKLGSRASPSRPPRARSL